MRKDRIMARTIIDEGKLDNCVFNLTRILIYKRRGFIEKENKNNAVLNLRGKGRQSRTFVHFQKQE
jgi:hypothetical protein